MQAKEDLLEALKAEPSNKDIRRELTTLKAKEKEEKERQRRVRRGALELYSCFTRSLLMLSSCFTHALLMMFTHALRILYSCFRCGAAN